MNSPWILACQVVTGDSWADVLAQEKETADASVWTLVGGGPETGDVHRGGTQYSQ